MKPPIIPCITLRMSPTTPKTFTAIGNACTDLMVYVDDAFLDAHNIRKYHCTHFTDPEKFHAFKASLPPFQKIPGGVGANVAHIVSALGGESHFISKIAADAEGLSFRTYMEDHGVTCHFPPASPAEIGSPQVPTLVTPDGERTFASYDGVALTFAASDYDMDQIKATDYLLLDGYCFSSPYTGDGFIKAATLATANGHHVTFNVGDLSNYEANTTTIDHLLSLVTSLTCNQAEAQAFFGETTPLPAILNIMADRYAFGAVTHGKDGAHIFAEGQIVHVPAADMADSVLVDTNGAGDHFTAGLIYGRMHDLDLDHTGRLASLCAKDCISHIGARPQGGKHALHHLVDQSRPARNHGSVR